MAQGRRRLPLNLASTAVPSTTHRDGPFPPPGASPRRQIWRPVALHLGGRPSPAPLPSIEEAADPAASSSSSPGGGLTLPSCLLPSRWRWPRVNPPREDVARRRCGSPARSTLPVGDLAQSARRPALRLEIWRRSGSSARPPPQIDNLVPAFGGSEISQAGTDGGGTERVLCTWEMEAARMDSAFSIDAVTTYASEVPHLCCNRWAGHVGLCSSPPHLACFPSDLALKASTSVDSKILVLPFPSSPSNPDLMPWFHLF